MIRSNFARATLALLCGVAASVNAQMNPNPTFHIGDQAPPIQVQGWVRGTPLIQFEPGKVYVLDFWATWCGGCVISFPHISGIAEKYKNKVTFVSIDSNEEIGWPDKKDIDSVADVKAFLQKPEGQALKLNVAVDGPTHSMWNTWIAGLHRVGLPSTFVIDQEGKVAWVDVNLDHLEWVLDEVLAKKWDRTRAAAAQRERDSAEDSMMKWAMTEDNADKKTSLKAMLDASEKFAKDFPERKGATGTYKVLAYLELDRDELPAVLEEIAAAQHPRYLDLNDAAGLTLREKTLSKETYAAAAKVLERCLGNEYPAANTCGKTVATYAELADAYNRAGDHNSAVANQEKALALVTKEKTTADQVQKLQADLKKYKAVGA
jgi:thiol-disulfide isomerase/thioredoxin